MEKTKKYLRKITSSNIGLSVYKFKDDYQITLGASKKITHAPIMVGMPMAGVPIGTFGAATMTFNPTVFAFNSYSNTLSTFIICRFDNKFNHIKGDVKKNAFDKINDFKKGEISYTIGESIFKYKDYYIRGNYTESTNEYKLQKFKD